MITIISGTNRVDNRTVKVAQKYEELLQRHEVESKLFDLQALPDDFAVASRSGKFDRSPEFLEMQEEFLFPAQKLLFVLPEYNGSIPGILKLVIDSCDVERAFYYKKACLTGVSTGRAGNLRGLDHLTNILHYLRMDIYANKIPISRIQEELDREGNWVHEKLEQDLQKQVEGFINY